MLRRDKSQDGTFEKRTLGEKVLYSFVFVLFFGYAFSLIYPFFWLIINSLKSFSDYALDIAQDRAFAFPTQLCIKNYQDAFQMIKTPEGDNYFIMFLNSIWQSFLPTALSMFSAANLAYALSRFKFKLRNIYYIVIIFTLTVPIVGNSGAAFKLYSDLKLKNTQLLLVVTSLGGIGLSFMVFYGFFKNIPYSYSEAVYMDGGNESVVYFKIILPQAIPCFVALGIVNFIGAWNNYMMPLLYLPSYPTISSGMYRVQNTLLRTGKTPIYFAGITLSVIPVIVIFCCFSDSIMKNMSVGGLKG